MTGQPRRRRPITWAHRIVLIQGGLLVAAAMVEAWGRLAGVDFDFTSRGLAATPIYYRRPDVPFGEAFYRRAGPEAWKGRVIATAMRQEGGINTTYDKEPVATITYDEDGFRNPAQLRDWELAIAGDSLTELGHLPYEQLFTTELGRLLGVRVKNLGVARTGPLTQVSYLTAYGKAPSTTDAVLVWFEGNDLHDALREEADLLYARTADRKRLAALNEPARQSSFMKALYRWMAHRLRRRDFANAYWMRQGLKIPVTVSYTPPSVAQLTPGVRAMLSAAFREWAKTAEALHLRPWLAYMPAKRRVLHSRLTFESSGDKRLAEWVPTDLPQFVQGLCEREGIRFVDLTPALVEAAEAGVLPYNTVWDSHLNFEGSRIVAEVLQEALEPYFSAKKEWAASAELVRAAENQ